MELSKREIEIIIRNLEFDNNIPNISTEERVSLLTKLRLVNKTNDIHDVSDCKKLNIHKCLNDLEKVIELKTGVLDFIDKGSLRYQLKKAIDKMICCR